MKNNTFTYTIRIVIAFLCSIYFGCNNDNELDIQQNFPFEIHIMPVPNEIKVGQKVEIRFTIVPTGNYKNRHYQLHYFQFDGEGILQYDNEEPYHPNDLYELPKEQFRLYYTSKSSVSQSFDVWISDNFGNEKQVSFQFNSRDKS
ncbi:DUF3872 domain-containing protein [Empedobacter brevis]|uniref:DUF3872 domain-containing protein n=1 Tax=Empedobacter brevis TaxID=247 RepID=UPI0028D06F13|nr:DUF3872 domain-containing protein [Empedobacter brevis]